MNLNELHPGMGATHNSKRVGRGTGSGVGKTCGRGHKGQKARSGGYHKVGFEGGQMPLQRRLPKIGFTSRVSQTTANVRLSSLNKLGEEVNTADLASLKAAGIVRKDIKRVKVFLSGELKKKVNLSGLAITKGAKAALEALGGTVN